MTQKGITTILNGAIRSLKECHLKKFRAFISYSHSDGIIASRLHRYLERFRIPRNLETMVVGPTARRLYPIFRDREELPTASDLGTQIRNALEKSEYLIVICTPRSAGSRWVNEEILAFKRMGKADRILALIADGEPNAIVKEGVPDESECFPEGLRHCLAEDGTLNYTTSTEPIAADCRSQGDGIRDAFLKIAAGLLAVGFDDLKRRENRKRRRLAMGFGSLALAIIVSLALLSVIALKNADVARSEKALARQQLYSSSILQARIQWDLKQHEKARKALWMAPAEYRSWEWGYLADMMYPEELTLELPEMEIRNFRWHSDILMAYSELNDLCIWNAKTGEEQLFIESRFNDDNDVESSPHPHWGISELSPDGTRIAMSYDDGHLHIRDTYSGETLATGFYEGSYNPGCTFSRDSRLLLIYDIGNDLEIREIASGRVTNKIENDTEITLARFFQNGRKIAALDDSGIIRILDTETGAVIHELGIGGEDFSSFSISPDHRLLSASSDTKRLRIWNLDDGLLFQTLSWSDSSDPETVIENQSPGVFNFDGTLLLMKTLDNTLRLWAVDSGFELRRMGGPDQSRIWAYQFSPDGFRFLVNRIGSVEIRETYSDETVRTIEGFNSTVPIATFSPDGGRIAVRDYENLRILEIEPNETWSVHEPEYDIREYAFGAEGELTILAESNDSLRIWDLPSGIGREIAVSGDMTAEVRMSADGTHLFLALIDGRIIVYNLISGTLISEYHGHISKGSNELVRFKGFAVSPDGSRVVSWGTEDGDPIQLWDTDSGTLICVLEDLSVDQTWSRRADYGFSADGHYLFVAEFDDYGTLYDTMTGELIHRFSRLSTIREDTAIDSFDFSDDGTRLAVRYQGGDKIYVFESHSGRRVQVLKDIGIGHQQFVLNADGSRAAVSSYGHLYVIDIASGAVLWSFERRGDTGILLEGFNPGSDRLLTVMYDGYSDVVTAGSVVVWDADTGDELLELPVQEDAYTSARFSDDGSRIAASYRGGGCILWSADPWNLSNTEFSGDSQGGSDASGRDAYFEWKRRQYAMKYASNGD